MIGIKFLIISNFPLGRFIILSINAGDRLFIVGVEGRMVSIYYFLIRQRFKI